MSIIESFRQLTISEARPFALNAEGYSVQGNMAIHVSQFLKNPTSTVVAKNRSPNGGILHYCRAIFRDADNNLLIYELVCDTQNRAVLKCTGEDLSKSSHFFVQEPKYAVKGSKSKLEPIFDEIKNLVLGEELI